MAMSTVEGVGTRWGIVATGNISTEFTRDLARLDDAEMTAVASRSQDSADRFGNQFGIEHRYDGAGYHYEAAAVMRALRDGLVECPALPHQDTVEILELLDETRRQIGVSYPGDDEHLGG